MPNIDFNNHEKEELTQKLKKYFDIELGIDVGQFDCEFFLDFISKELGAYYYNQGLRDAQVILSNKFDDLHHTIDELEKPIKL